MASRRFTVDLVKKKEFINIFLLMLESSILNAMRQATFTEEDIANLRMRRFLQRAGVEGLHCWTPSTATQLPPT